MGHRAIDYEELLKSDLNVTSLLSEEFAKENKLGMWSMKFQYPWDFRKS